MQTPTPGRIVHTMTVHGLRPAIITATGADIDPEAVEIGACPDLIGEGAVHLVMFDYRTLPTHGGGIGSGLPAAAAVHNCQYAEDTGDGIPVGTWTWPEVR